MPIYLIKEQVRAYYPEFYDCVKIVGSLTADELLEKSRNFNREEELLKLNLDPSKKTIMIASSWGPYCLIQNQGEELIEQINRLQDEFNIVVSRGQGKLANKIIRVGHMVNIGDTDLDKFLDAFQTTTKKF